MATLQRNLETTAEPEPRPRILVIEDEAEHADLVTTVLKTARCEAVVANTGNAGLRELRLPTFDLVVLDVGLPGLSGIEVCRRIRQDSDIPIIILTGFDQSATIVHALELGADDYVQTPFEPMELVARIRAVLRRSSFAAEPTSRRPYLHGNLRFDFQQWQAYVDDQEVALTATDTKILAGLAANAGRVMTFDELLSEVWGPEYVGDNLLVRVAMSRLRAKIEADTGTPVHIITRSGVGYMASGPDQEPVERATN